MNYKFSDIREAEVYCGTYKKYNEGSLFGEWMRLADYDSKESFIEACKELHKDENDPEFMFQDWQYVPDSLMGESHISESIWEMLDMDDDDLEILTAWLDYHGLNNNIDSELQSAKDAYMGKYGSDEDFAQALAEECEEIPDRWHCYIDWEAYARDLMYDFFESNALYFSCY